MRAAGILRQPAAAYYYMLIVATRAVQVKVSTTRVSGWVKEIGRKASSIHPLTRMVLPW
jgi:hypothetical protein